MVRIYLNKTYSSDPMCNGDGYCVMCIPLPPPNSTNSPLSDLFYAPCLELGHLAQRGACGRLTCSALWPIELKIVMKNYFPIISSSEKNNFPKFHSFLKQYLARSSVDKILGYLQLISAKLAWKSAESNPKLWQLKILWNNGLKINGL